MADDVVVGRDARDIRPRVAQPTGGYSVAIFAAILIAIGGGFLYTVQMGILNSDANSKIKDADAANGAISSPADLILPTYVQPPAMWTDGERRTQALRNSPFVVNAQRHSVPPRSYAGATVLPQTEASPAPSFSSAPNYAAVSNGNNNVNSAYEAPSFPSPQAASSNTARAGESRVNASRLPNPSMTVPQGSVIQAVMETALDSTRPGFARAIISRDVMSFDGTRLLIPKGSKLFGEYKADLSLGEKRALIQWHRLTRPDGAIINMDSPSADPLGRAGVKGKVDTHFFERFGGVILQSVLDLGVRAATVKATGDTIVFGIPPATQGAIVQQPGEVRPTLKVRQGTSIAVFVARDLDFSTVE